MSEAYTATCGQCASVFQTWDGKSPKLCECCAEERELLLAPLKAEINRLTKRCEGVRPLIDEVDWMSPSWQKSRRHWLAGKP